jgi:hypothetical protein
MGFSKEGWQEHGKKEVCGWLCSRQDHSKRQSIQEEGMRSVGQYIYHHGIFWQRKGGRRGETRGVLFFLACFVSFFIVLRFC